ncbi:MULTISPECIES: mycofactocin-coupled SDR family oxidoreductase [Rhodococcus]|jgi:SDR family mycofactocin-dependent oxidoreductase|uniref:Mycofactocin-coupled SDR family oxidoreductase n=1 Tax=Rhodococcus oxybenzonivorans TaxID=1990687 RepID=A0AAE5A6H7_9NOCA|nr:MULTISPECIES: mycofactocin-coupled SDR family oxidoreductase [Rhodococcus]MDV7242555.1 mycofactocin-coupled SDR family oxidoreductase [Rhodococcus oxybenzonivorans]MDV7265940.1 mycofactocin-coupled SDR family oxidoreductase [Rhodococcus oxybenzonivorans]MDV7275987.1 mycofactocin-coupled SDR family oxidoreductase [Rhodococcus oxybenzonivorans]MDV7332044.1 mycofactocin-coupled SDR family oxidoreductase [Rhodococcus oxybenzonivorans]MDV7344264.1 mycofactocin-coupled SDR family oxidoreductase [
MNRVAGKVVLITGAARGQGRSHAVHLADEGADIIAFDLCEDIASNGYPLATPADLEETGKLVEKAGRRVVTAKVDVRDRAALKRELDAAVARLGRLDVVVANAGIAPLGNDVPVEGFVDAFDVDFVGVVNTIHVALPHLGGGASIIATGSVAGLVPQTGLNGQQALQGPGGDGYGLAKKMLQTYTHSLALTLGPKSIRVNAIHPTNCNTDMLQSPPMFRTFRPDLENPTAEDAKVTFPFMQAMPTPWVEPEDISHAVVYLSSDESRFVTGQQLRVDAGAGLKLGV